MINAGSETAPEKPYFRRAFRERQCLILADGFYAWKRENGAKQPCYFHMQEGRPFAFSPASGRAGTKTRRFAPARF
jgi:putative SOS response-associated peptidase YedK